MGREVDNLIAENNELLATKNALNIVKDDLIGLDVKDRLGHMGKRAFVAVRHAHAAAGVDVVADDGAVLDVSEEAKVL